MKRLLLGFLFVTCVLPISEAASPEAIAQEILDSKKPTSEREALIADNLEQAAPLLKAMTSNLEVGTPEEYRRIPWLWRLAVAVGKGNSPEQLKNILSLSLPRNDQPLHHWQAVVIG